MAYAGRVLFAITSILAAQIGHSVSLKFAEGPNSLDASPLATPAGHHEEGFNIMKELHKLMDLQAQAGRQAPGAPGAPGLPPFDPSALLTQITNTVNQSLDLVSTKADEFVDRLEIKTDQLLAKANASWSQYTAQLTNTMAIFTEETVDTIHAISDLVGLASQMDGMVPELGGELGVALQDLSTAIDSWANSSAIALNVSQGQQLAYVDAENMVIQLNRTLYIGLDLAFNGTSKLDTGFATLVPQIMSGIQALPNVPEVVIPTIQQVFDSVRTTVGRFRVTVNRALAIFVSGVSEASFNAIAFLNEPQSPGSQSGASGVAPLFAAMLAVVAVAFA